MADEARLVPTDHDGQVTSGCRRDSPWAVRCYKPTHHVILTNYRLAFMFTFALLRRGVVLFFQHDAHRIGQIGQRHGGFRFVSR